MDNTKLLHDCLYFIEPFNNIVHRQRKFRQLEFILFSQKYKFLDILYGYASMKSIIYQHYIEKKLECE